MAPDEPPVPDPSKPVPFNEQFRALQAFRKKASRERRPGGPPSKTEEFRTHQAFAQLLRENFGINRVVSVLRDSPSFCLYRDLKEHARRLNRRITDADIEATDRHVRNIYGTIAHRSPVIIRNESEPKTYGREISLVIEFNHVLFGRDTSKPVADHISEKAREICGPAVRGYGGKRALPDSKP
jgi:hypothetical protein